MWPLDCDSSLSASGLLKSPYITKHSSIKNGFTAGTLKKMLRNMLEELMVVRSEGKGGLRNGVLGILGVRQ